MIELDRNTLARLHIAMKEQREIQIQYHNVLLQTASGGGPWGVPMVVGYCADCGCYTVRQWCRSVEELAERLGRL